MKEVGSSGWTRREVLPPPLRSEWPSWAMPIALLVQLLHVWSMPSVYARPSVCEPVRISCVFGMSPTPLTNAFFSVSVPALD